MRTIRIGHHVITDSSAPYIIAEIGVNHEGSIARAKEMIELAKEAGASAAKFQAYRAERLAVEDSPAYWDTSQERTESQFKLFKKYDKFGVEDFHELAEHCKRLGLDFLCTPFDKEFADELAPLMPCVKVASADLTNLPLLRHVAGYGKPVVLSTGAATLAEIDRAVGELELAGCEDIVLLHCILNYPTSRDDANLNMISSLRRSYPSLIVGYSDHTLPEGPVSVIAVAYLLGARVIEKHFTFDKELPGNDHYHAMDATDLARFVEQVEQVRQLVGDAPYKHPLESEGPARANARRSIVLVRDVQKGTQLTAVDLTCKRPATGISPIHWDDIIGRHAAADLRADHVLQWRDLA